MRKSKSRTSNNIVRAQRPPRGPERNCNTDGVYSNNYFMHAATCHVGTVVKLETAQGATYEGIFKTFSHDFDVVLELAHKVDVNDPEKLNSHEVVDNLIFQSKDIVYMCAQNIDPGYAIKDSFQTDSNISKFNGEVTGEKELTPWEGPTCNGEEYDLDGNENNQQNGWDVNDMFMANNKKFGVQSSYDDTLADYTCQLQKKDTKDFKDDEAKAARIALEIEKNPSSQARSALEDGDNEEEVFAAVSRSVTETDGKYVPPAIRKRTQHHRNGNTRGNYSANGNQRSYNVPDSPGRQQMNNSATLPRYHHQTSQQYHQQTHGSHSQSLRENNNNRSSPENKNASSMCTSVVPQPQNIPSYSTNMHQRSYSQNVISGAPNHSQNVPIQQPKSQRTSPIAVPNGGSDYQSKQLSSASQQTTHQYHNQNQQQSQNGNNINTQRKQHHSHHQHHHSNTRGREEQINELRKFGSDFNLSSPPYDVKSAKEEAPKQIQVVTSRNKSPPVPQPPSFERNVVPVTIVPTLPPNKSTQNTVTTQPPQQTMIISSTQQTISPTGQQSMAVPQPPSNMAAQATSQVAIKQHPGAPVMSQPTAPSHYQQNPHSQQQHQQLHLQQRGDPQQVLMHQTHLQQGIPQSALQHHAQQSNVLQQKPPPPSQQPKSLPLLHQSPPSVLQMQMQSQPPVQIQQHPAAAAAAAAVAASQNQTKPVIPTQSVQAVMPTNVPNPNVAAAQLQQQQRPPTLPQQQSAKIHNSQSSPLSEINTPDTDRGTDKSIAKDHDDDSTDDAASTLKKSTLNPNAKEFVYNPAPKSYTPISRSPSTPSQSRPHTPQTPSYNMHPANTAAAAGIQMVMPTYVVAAPTAAYVPAAPPQSNRLRKVTVGPHRNDYHPSNMQVAAATGQPLLAPSVSLAQPALAPGTQFAVQGYAHHHHLAAAAAAAAAAQPYQHVQMVRMVPQQGGGMVPLVPSSISYHDTTGSSATAMYVNHGNGTASVAMAPHTPHVHHPQQHPPPSTAPSPSQTPQGPSQSHTPNSYQQPPMATQSVPPYPPIMCPVIQAPPPHGPPHHMVAAAQAQQHTMQQYIQHPQVAHQPHIQVSLIPHSCS